MPSPSKISQLPKNILAELNERLITGNFSDYVGLSAWLKSQGYEISKSSVGDYGKEMKDSMADTMLKARLRVETAIQAGRLSSDEKAALMEAGEMTAYDQMFDVLDGIKKWDVKDKAAIIPKLSRAMADISRSAIGSAKWRKDFEAEARAKAREEAAAAATTAAKAEGVSETGIARIREALGMVS